jgi:hypothetical protein
MSKSRGQTKWSPWSSILGFGRGVNYPIQKNLLSGILQTPCRSTIENFQNPRRVVAPENKKWSYRKILMFRRDILPVCSGLKCVFSEIGLEHDQHKIKFVDRKMVFYTDTQHMFLHRI